MHAWSVIAGDHCFSNSCTLLLHKSYNNQASHRRRLFVSLWCLRASGHIINLSDLRSVRRVQTRKNSVRFNYEDKAHKKNNQKKQSPKRRNFRRSRKKKRPPHPARQACPLFPCSSFESALHNSPSAHVGVVVVRM